MSGEINGTGVILQNATGAIVGQMEMSVEYLGDLISIANKSAGDNQTFLAGERANSGINISGTLVYNSDVQYRAVRAAYEAVTKEAYTLTFTSDATTDEALSADMFVATMGDSIPHGDKVSTSIQFSSDQTVTRTDAVT